MGYVSLVLAKFSWKFTDMDQVIQWYGRSEFEHGNLHMFRFFGQEYGTMLEAFVSLLFPFLAPEIALPITTALMLLTAFVLPITLTLVKRQFLLILIGFLCLFPPEYFMLSFMPRDFVSGIFITALAFPLLKREKPWSYILIGLICLMGWSFNNNAALLGASISVFAAFPNNKISWKAVAYMAIGYGVGLAIHVGLGHYYTLRPELIVHKAWDFHYAWKQLMDGWSNLDRHFAWITPALQYKGWFYIPIFFAVAVYAGIKRQYAVFVSVIILFLLTFFAFGVLKIHDGRDSVFFSHERMFLALPISLFFLITRLKWARVGISALIGVGAVLALISIWRLDDVIDKRINPNKDHVVTISTVNQFYSDCETLHQLCVDNEVEVVVIGPMAEAFGHIHSSGCNSLFKDVTILDPGYERKTWDMRKVDAMRVSKFIWHSTSIHDGALVDPSVHSVQGISGYENTFLINGNDMNVLEIYRSMGFQTSNY